jgi:hypothetical protein
VCWGGVVCYFLRISLFPSHIDFLVSAKVKVDSVAAKKKPQQAFRTKKHVCTFDRKKEIKIERAPQSVEQYWLAYPRVQTFYDSLLGKKRGQRKTGNIWFHFQPALIINEERENTVSRGKKKKIERNS